MVSSCRNVLQERNWFNSSGSELDKFEAFGLTATSAACVGAPLISECYANFECRLADGRQIFSLGSLKVPAAYIKPGQ
ncbi:flavin reductase [Stutzerimonas stutzeri]|uniref:flavin reductase n=1 Tax=Stutzerimonas stutzeri TaxID=316 RepID=UPI003C7061B5